jgi:hypothetical protein
MMTLLRTFEKSRISLITCKRLVEHVFAMLMSLTYSSVSGANLRISIAPMMPDNGVLRKKWYNQASVKLNGDMSDTCYVYFWLLIKPLI